MMCAALSLQVSELDLLLLEAEAEETAEGLQAMCDATWAATGLTEEQVWWGAREESVPARGHVCARGRLLTIVVMPGGECTLQHLAAFHSPDLPARPLAGGRPRAALC